MGGGLIATPPTWVDFLEYRIKPPEKKMVTMWQWLYRTPRGMIKTTDFFYKNEDIAQNKIMTFGRVIGPAEWTRIEVEEP